MGVLAPLPGHIWAGVAPLLVLQDPVSDGLQTSSLLICLGQSLSGGQHWLPKSQVPFMIMFMALK